MKIKGENFPIILIFNIKTTTKFSYFDHSTIAENVIKYYIFVINYNPTHITYCVKVIVRGCQQLEAIIPGPDYGHDKFQWFSKGFKHKVEKEEFISDQGEGYLLSRVCEWRINMKTGNASERYLTGSELPVDLPMINDQFIGQYNKYGYAQVLDSIASSICGNKMMIF